MDRVEIGLLRLDEAEALVDLAERIWRTCYPGMISIEQIDYMLEQRYRPGLVRQLLARGDLWLAARAQGELIGFAHGHPLPGDDYKLDKLYVRPDLQRHGIGAALIAKTVRHARHHGSERLILRVNRQNHPAIQSYLKHGFRIASLMTEDIGQGYVMDDYVMALALEAPR